LRVQSTSLEPKAKTRCELGFPCSSCTEAYAKSCGMIYNKEKWVLLSVAQQEIDKLKRQLEDKKFWSRSKGVALAKCDHAHTELDLKVKKMERERDLQKQKLQEKAIRLLMLRAGGSYRMFEAGMLYQCLVLLGMQEFTRHEQVNTLEKTTCHYLHESDAKKQLEELLRE